MTEIHRDDAAPTDRRAGAAAFWSRDDVEEARRLLDLWASQRRYMDEGGQEVLRADRVFEIVPDAGEEVEDARPKVRILRNGLWYVEELEHKKSSTPLTRKIPLTMLATMFVNAVLVEMDLSLERSKGAVSLAEALILHLYPRTGPLAQSGSYADFNPRGFTGCLDGKYMDRAKETFLRQVERDFVQKLVQAGRNPKRFFQGFDGRQVTGRKRAADIAGADATT